jgi:hypothetical protein
MKGACLKMAHVGTLILYSYPAFSDVHCFIIIFEAQSQRQKGQRFILTGGSSGLEKETAGSRVRTGDPIVFVWILVTVVVIFNPVPRSRQSDRRFTNYTQLQKKKKK